MFGSEADSRFFTTNLSSESCHANTVHPTRKLVSWSRQSERAEGLIVPYNGKHLGFLFHAVSSYVAFYEAQRVLLFTLACFSPSSSFLSPTAPVSTHLRYCPQIWPLSSLPTYHTRSPDRIYLNHRLP